jgi:hypothetical protein
VGELLLRVVMSAWCTVDDVAEVRAGEADMAASAVWWCAVSWARSRQCDMLRCSRGRSGEAREEGTKRATHQIAQSGRSESTAGGRRWASTVYARMPDPRSA